MIAVWYNTQKIDRVAYDLGQRIPALVIIQIGDSVKSTVADEDKIDLQRANLLLLRLPIYEIFRSTQSDWTSRRSRRWRGPPHSKAGTWEIPEVHELDLMLAVVEQVADIFYCYKCESQGPRELMLKDPNNPDTCRNFKVRD